MYIYIWYRSSKSGLIAKCASESEKFHTRFSRVGDPGEPVAQSMAECFINIHLAMDGCE